MWRIFLTVSLLCWSADGQDRKVTCRDHDDKEVDWYIIYKAPRLTDIGTTGLEYLYIDSKGKTFKDHNKFINNPDGVLGRTLRPIFTQSPPAGFGFISYSDQPPGCHADNKFGHSKGVVMMDKTTGVWLSHSTPQFPFKRDKDDFYPSSGAAKAQTFICVTFNYDQFKHIGKHLLYIAAFPFDHHIPADFHTELKQVTDTRKNTPEELIQDLKSKGGISFRSFAKKLYKDTKKTTNAGQKRKQGTSAAPADPDRSDGDLYRTIAKKYDTDVRVQTWGCQKERSGSYCVQNQHQVINIKSVKADLGNGEVKWKASSDHSKWCVAKDNNNNDLICIADSNRAVSQYERPGGALCFKHPEASNLFKGLIDQTDNCNGASNTASNSDCDTMDTTN